MNTSLRNPGEFDLRGYTVLIIDDEPANLGVMSDYLGSFGLGVLIARDGESGLERAQYAQPDLILLDALMPVTTHLRLRALTRELEKAKETLEQRVEERTAGLAQANLELQAEISERARAEKERSARWRKSKASSARCPKA